MKTLLSVAPLAIALILPTCCTTSGGRQATGTVGIGGIGECPVVLVEIFMDTRPFQEQRGHSGSTLTIQTNDGDFSAKPHVRVDRELKADLTRQGIAVLNRGAGRAPVILSGEIRHFHGQIQLTRLPGTKQTTTSSFLPANFHATVQLLATLFDVEQQRVLFRESFLATRNERHSMSESNPREAKRGLVALVEECLQEATSAVAEKTASEIRSATPHSSRSP